MRSLTTTSLGALIGLGLGLVVSGCSDGGKTYVPVPSGGAAAGFTITTTTLADATVGQSYTQTLASSGGSGAVAFTLSSGSLPAGLSLSGAGTISGTPTASGSATFTVLATDTSSPAQQDLQTLVLTVLVGGGGGGITVSGTFYDGATGQPLAGVGVFIEGRTDVQTSDASGNFSFSNVSTPYTISKTYKDSAGRVNTDTYVDVSRASWGSNDTFSEVPTLGQVGTVTGNVIGATSSTVASNFGDGMFSGRFATLSPDANGNPAYTIFVVPNQPYVLTALVQSGVAVVDGAIATGNAAIAPGATSTVDMTLLGAGQIQNPTVGSITLGPSYQASTTLMGFMDASRPTLQIGEWGENGALLLGVMVPSGSGANRTYTLPHLPTGSLSGFTTSVWFNGPGTNSGAYVKKPYSGGALPALVTSEPPTITSSPGAGFLSSRVVSWTAPPALVPSYYEVVLIQGMNMWSVSVPASTTSVTLPSMPASLSGNDFSPGTTTSLSLQAIKQAGFSSFDTLDPLASVSDVEATLTVAPPFTP